MKRANGSGSVYKLSGKRRRPYAAAITKGYSIEKKRNEQEIIGYFINAKDAQDALTDYYRGVENNNISIYTKKAPTFHEIWNEVYEKKISKKSKSTKANYRSNFRKFKKIHNTSINFITLKMMQDIIDEEIERGIGSDTTSTMKTVCITIFDYAIKKQYIKKESDYTIYLETADRKKSEKTKLFKPEEIKLLIDDNTIESKIILCYLYTGTRPIELVNISKDDFHLNELCNDDGNEQIVSYFIAGSKTENGKNRIIPIHKDAEKAFLDVLSLNHKYFTGTAKAHWGYKKYLAMFHRVMKRLNMDHVPYDTRHTFITYAKISHMDDFASRKIVGHSQKDVTTQVYTHGVVNFLYNEMQKLKY